MDGWNGPVLLAMDKPNNTQSIVFDSVHNDIRRFLNHPLQRAFDTAVAAYLGLHHKKAKGINNALCHLPCCSWILFRDVILSFRKLAECAFSPPQLQCEHPI